MYIHHEQIKYFIGALSISLLGLGHTANAAFILLAEDHQLSATTTILTSTGVDQTTSTKNTIGDFSDFDDSVVLATTHVEGSANGTAQQTSRVSTTSIFATGTAEAAATLNLEPFFAFGASRSFYSLTFVLTTPQLFDLSGSLSTTESGFSATGQADVSLISRDGSFSLALGTPDNVEGSSKTPFNLSGTLLPDTYTFFAGADFDANASSVINVPNGAAEFIFQFDVTPVPIPPAAWLFGSGLLGLIGIARKKAT